MFNVTKYRKEKKEKAVSLSFLRGITETIMRKNIKFIIKTTKYKTRVCFLKGKVEEVIQILLLLLVLVSTAPIAPQKADLQILLLLLLLWIAPIAPQKAESEATATVQPQPVAVPPRHVILPRVGGRVFNIVLGLLQQFKVGRQGHSQIGGESLFQFQRRFGINIQHAQMAAVRVNAAQY